MSNEESGGDGNGVEEIVEEDARRVLYLGIRVLKDLNIAIEA